MICFVGQSLWTRFFFFLVVIAFSYFYTNNYSLI